MALLVQKFGGTSVGSAERIAAVADRIIRARAKGHRLVVVVSAMSGETNRLVQLAQQINPSAGGRDYDMVIATGEQVTVGLLALALQHRGCKAQALLGWQVPIETDQAFGKARIQNIASENIHRLLDEDQVVIVAGFQGVTEVGEVTTLGRGGSDTTAVAIAAAIKADECQIFTDVDGVYTTDPRVVERARKLSKITFEEMLEMASLGSKVLQIRSVEFAGKYNVPLRVLSSFDEGPGTLITLDNEESTMEQPLISGIAFSRDEAKITVQGVPDVPGAAYQILGPIGAANIEVDMIVQNVGMNKTTDFTFTIQRGDYKKAMKVLESSLVNMSGVQLKGTEDICKVSLVGVGMRSHAGIASQMFKVLADEVINIQMISTSEIKISIVINEKYLELAVRALHTAFGLDAPQDLSEIAETPSA
ncbi:MAG: aspartate kinase [Pseudomonadota bacterium]